MRIGKRLVISFATLFTVLSAVEGFAQTPTPSTRIPQQVVINGQRTNATYVTAPNGSLQSFTCDNPQQFVTPEGASQGWACYEQSTGTWLLNSLPPAQIQTVPAPISVPSPAPTVAYQQPQVVIYQQAPPPDVYYSNSRHSVVVRPPYRASVIIGAAAINAAGRIAAAAVRHGHGRVSYDRPAHHQRPHHRRR